LKIKEALSLVSRGKKNENEKNLQLFQNLKEIAIFMKEPTKELWISVVLLLPLVFFIYLLRMAVLSQIIL
jgi:hypothetical protein